MIIFSEICEEDVEELSRIEAETFSMPWKAKDFLEMIELPYAYYICAKENGELLGCCGVRNMAGEGEITNVVIKKERRGEGIGELMLRYLLDTAAQKGMNAFTLEVRKSNYKAISLYEKLGFECEGVRKNFYEKPVEDGLIYWKRGI